MTFGDDPLPKMESFAKKDLKKWITKLKKKLTLEDQPADSEKIEIIPKLGFNRYVRTSMFIKRINEELARRETLDKTKSDKKDAKLDKNLPVKVSSKPPNIIIPPLGDLTPIQIEQDEEPSLVKEFRTSEINKVTTRSMMRKLEEFPMSPLSAGTSGVFSFPSPNRNVKSGNTMTMSSKRTPPGPSGIRNSKLKAVEAMFFNISFTTNQKSRTIEAFKINGMATLIMMKKAKEGSTPSSTLQIPKKVVSLCPQKENMRNGKSKPLSSKRSSPGPSGTQNSELESVKEPSTAKLVETPESCRVSTRSMMKKETQAFASPSTPQIPQIATSLRTLKENVKLEESMPTSSEKNFPGPSGICNSDLKPVEAMFSDISFTTSQELRTIETFKINRIIPFSMLKKGECIPTSSSTPVNRQNSTGISRSEMESVKEPSTAKLSEDLENCRITTRKMMKKEVQAFTSPSTSEIPQQASSSPTPKENVPVEESMPSSSTRVSPGHYIPHHRHSS